MEQYKTIKRFDNSPEANIAKNFLIDRGINALLQDEHTGEMFNPVVKGIKLIVPEHQVEETYQLLNEINETIDEPDNEIIEILEECGCLLTGHFKLTSGLHSNKYIEKIKVIQNPQQVEKLSSLLVDKLKEVGVDVVIGLAMGGIVLGYEVAKQLKKQFVFTKRKDGKMSVRSGFDLHKGMKAVIIEDIVTTGGSVKEVLDLMQTMDIEVTAVGLLVDRTGGDLDFGVRTESLLSIKVDAYKPEECPLCKENIPLTVPGSSDKK